MARLTKAQAESLKSQAKSEEQVLKEVERSYDDALKVIEERLKKLQEREQTQSVIYQRKYQEMLRNQLTEVLEDMQDVQYTKVSDYLYECYENNYVYAMYDIHKQGVPVVVPIDQTQVVEAVKTDSKLSKSLYATMGKSITELKEQITRELSRGIASGMMHADIARNLKRRAGVAMRYTYRIIRTEGHRIQCKAAEDAQRAAKAKGADVVKQWDATLDGRTRRDHRKLDGQIRELDEPFEVGGHKAMRPGGFGRPEQDINCRCALLQRARWALDDEELDRLKERAKLHGLDKSEDIEDFKKKYLKAAEKVEKAVETAKKVAKSAAMTVENFPQAFQKGVAKKRAKIFEGIVNSVEGSDGKTKRLYSLMGNIPYFLTGGKHKARFTESKHYVSASPFDGYEVSIPKMEGEYLRGQSITFAHGLAHFIDTSMDESRFSAFRSEAIADAARSIPASEIPKWVKDESAELREKAEKERKKLSEKMREEVAKLEEKLYAYEISYKEYKKQHNAVWKAYQNDTDKITREIFDGFNALEDIYDALTRGEAQGSGAVYFGHGSRYYSKGNNVIVEIWAQYCTLQLMRPDLMERFRKDQPELCEALDGLRDDLLAEVENG